MAGISLAQFTWTIFKHNWAGQAGKPMQNAFVESFNGRLRDECMNENLFGNLSEARQTIETWRIDYNTQRPHTSLGGLAPAVYAKRNENGMLRLS